MLDVRDVGATIAWYTDVLGFTLVNSFADEDGTPNWALLTRDEVKLMCNRFSPHTHDDGEEHDHEHPEAPVLSGSLYVDVDDVDALAAELAGKATLAYGPLDQYYGQREIGLTDPDGYFLIFGSPVTG
jgi:catechol 2,3-dioxygenase-like lactoylglutathione lyase family enzyme